MNKEFERYHSIELSIHEKQINGNLARNEDMGNATYILTEKIDGANFSFYISDTEARYAKRSTFLLEDEKFYGYQEVVARYVDRLKSIQQKYWKGKTVRFIGELYGKGIMRRINYGETKQFRIFDIEVDNVYLPQKEIINIVPADLFVPFVAIVKGLSTALNYESVFSTKVGDSGDICEGIVIKPYEEYRQGFYIKKKNIEFTEMKIKKKVFVVADIEAQEEFCRYINTNRLASVVSKLGALNEFKQIPTYVKELMEDAKEEYFLTHDDTKDKNVFRKGNKEAINLIKEEITKETKNE